VTLVTDLYMNQLSIWYSRRLAGNVLIRQGSRH
jgi:hypothetical protein